jgi:rubrerythrin
MNTTEQWLSHFKSNANEHRIDWSLSPTMSEEKKKVILYSLKAWQKGETSEGNHLRIAAQRYADEIDDQAYVKVIDLFIKEEQKHGESLGRYIDAIGEKRTSFDLGDQVFRYVRGWNKSITSWTMAVIIIEQAAQVFYQALKDGTNCKLMNQICTDILIDEAYHIQFQNERLAIIMALKKPFWRAQYLLIFKLLFEVTHRTIWFAHAKAFIHGGCSRQRFESRMRFKFQKTLKLISEQNKKVTTITVDS